MKWEKVKLEDIVKLTKGKKHSEVDDTNAYRYLQIEDLHGSGTNKYTNEDGVLCDPSDLLIAWDGANAGKVGTGLHGMAGSTLARISVTADNVSSKYLYWYLSSNFEVIKSKRTGATIPHVNGSELRSMMVPLPPLHIQERIADTLDKADALRRKDQELLQKYDELAQAIFYDMFGDPVRNEKGWELKTIQQLVTKSRHSIKRGPFGGALKKEIFVDEGYLVFEQYHALNNDFSFERYFINEEKYKELIAFNVDPGDIIISCSGVYLGKLAEVPQGVKKGIINQALLKVSLDQSVYKNDFFITVFSNPNFKEKYFASERGAAIPNFPPMSVFKEFKFIFPPLELQEKYMQITNNINSSKDKLDDQPLLFEALLSKYFS